ncbi:BMP family ABC transporter substrate-binding protein [Uliginosibacterium sp. H3]|uniref:BMP family ABC transporter substrate-binding protein n=1 Tax=Uliginosibacterium silvisoli TaxID=3114758 RepID=A0ABU6K2F3_9RHOO|nr:BMP family ABC transporter substrate-binding protein [Uliginosibacterium sp. H3]
MQDTSNSRRTFLKTSAAASVSLALGGQVSRALAADGLTIGIVYVGAKDDYGWNMSHAVGIAPLAKVPGVKIVQQERVPETKEVATAIESMIQQEGAKLILGTSFGYFNPFMVDLAKKYPNVEFRHPTTLWSADKHPKNLGSYYSYMDQAHYVDGIAAGLSTKSNKIGFVCAKPIPLVLRNINSVRVALNKVNPKATLQVIFTGEWTLPVREAEATNALIDSGCDVILTHVDSPKVCIETAERRGAKSCGHNVSQASIAPKGFITGGENKYETIYKLYAEELKKGRKLPNMLTGGFDKDMVQNTPFGAGATEAARKAAAEATADLKAGKPIFTGVHKDQSGKVVLDKTYGNYDPVLDQMNYMLEGVTGSLT